MGHYYKVTRPNAQGVDETRIYYGVTKEEHLAIQAQYDRMRREAAERRREAGFKRISMDAEKMKAKEQLRRFETDGGENEIEF